MEICGKHGIGKATYYRRKDEYAGLDVSQLWNLKEVENELARLKRMLPTWRLKATR